MIMINNNITKLCEKILNPKHSKIISNYNQQIANFVSFEKCSLINLPWFVY